MARVVVIDDDVRTHETIRHLLGPAHSVTRYPHGVLAVDAVRDLSPDIVFVSLDLADVDGVSLVSRLSGRSEGPAVIAVCRAATPGRIVRAVRAGAYDVLGHPLGPEELRSACLRALAAMGPPPDAGRSGTEEIVGVSPAMERVRATVYRVARSDAPVLITGESGVGKELVARAIHRLSGHSGGPFEARNCGAIPDQLFESEMFGTERGAYTGAVRRPGAFELADAGTLFLDEIGELSHAAQVKLLRAIEGGFHRVGGTEERRTNVRVLAATNRDLQEAMRSGSFREDLFYRVNVLRVSIPPLRSRREDIPFLVRHFSRQADAADPREFAADALARLSGHDWPGNIRELRNVVHRALVCAERSPIGGEDIFFG